ncbi:MAG: iron chelate uptake ABC transporter family permease subunit, partial [Duncaniella sp.]|nr:iron chelate uptake ABC transporter family permease subunit [Duncaniella sp.]
MMFLTGISIPVFFLLNLLLGSVEIPAGAVVDILVGRGGDNVIWQNIVLKSRVPQSLTAVMAGAGLAVS